MNIGYFTSGLPYRNPLTGEFTRNYTGGGVENVAYNLAKEMARRGHKAYIFTSSIDKTEEIEQYGNIIVYRYPKRFSIGQAPMSPDILYKPLKHLQIDIIHSHIGNMPAPLGGLLYAKKYKKPFVITHHNEWISGYGSITRRLGVSIYKKFLSDPIYKAADKIIALSDNQIEDSSLLTKYKNKVEIIPNGINPSEFEILSTKEECRQKLGLPKNKKIILFVGSLTKRKGVHILLESMNELLKKHPDSYLVYVGEGEIRKELEEKTRKNGLKSTVKFVGNISDQDMKGMFYKSADLFCLPSYEESFGIVLLEAAMFELPLVVSNLKTVKGLIGNEKGGVVTKIGDSANLAEKISQVLSNPSFAATLGTNARKRVNEFTWEKISGKTLELYQRVLDEHK